MSLTAGGPALPISRPLRADARRNRDRVMVAARLAFAEYGRDAQMDEIARRAQVGVGTVYRHFPTKEALIGALVEDAFARVAAHARAALALEDPWETFTSVIWFGAEQIAGDRVMAEVLADMPEAMESARGPDADLFDSMAEIMRRAQAAGVLRADACVHDIPMIMCGVGMGSLKEHPCEASWRRHVALLIDGLRAGSAHTPLPG